MAGQLPIVHPATEKAAPPHSPEYLHARYAPRIRRHVRAVLGSEHEHDDLVQEVLLVIITKIDTVRDPACLDFWVSRVTANSLKQFLRRRRVRSHASLDDVAEGVLPTLAADFQARELASRALDVMVSLPSKDRELLTSYWLSPAKAEAIAAKIGCSVITLRRRLSRAQARFERLARRDPALARCIDDARGWSRRWRSAPSGVFPTSVGVANDNLARVPTNRRVWLGIHRSLAP
jgi:RNA polymerase sigma-70 factor (ECF subfamily)